MVFPLDAETYFVGRRCYRRNPVKQNKVAVVEDSGDLPDMYADEGEPSCTMSYDKKQPEIKKVEVERKEESFKKPSHLENKEPRKNSPQEAAMEPETVVCAEDERISCTITPGKARQWSSQINIPSAFHGKLIGVRGNTRRELEESTSCRLTIPRRGEEGPTIIKSFQSLESVQRCLDRLELFLMEARKTARFTHFASFPLDHPDIVETYNMFRESVLQGEHLPESCRNPALFLPSNRLHITCAMLWLLEQSDKETLRNSLEAIKADILTYLDGQSIVADVQGIQIMNDDPSSVDVLYAVVKGEKLQHIANLVRVRLSQTGLSPEENWGDRVDETDVKLHMTLMNKKYAAVNWKSKPFDATQILQDNKDFYFGTVCLKKISICAMGGSSDNGYDVLLSIDLCK